MEILKLQQPQKEDNMKFKTTLLTLALSVTGFTFGNAASQKSSVSKKFLPKTYVVGPKIETESFYQKFSMLYTTPAYGVGYRKRSETFAYDLSISISPLYVTNAVAVRAAVLAFLGSKGSIGSAPYIGLGIGGIGTYNTAVKDKRFPKVGLYDRQEKNLVARGTGNLVLGYQETNGFWELDLGVTPKYATTEKAIKPTKANLDGKIVGFSVIASKGWNF
jgi:hypothetical protein